MKTLIVKIGSKGDVVRTTVLLSVLKEEIYWLATKDVKILLNSKKITKNYFIEDDLSELFKTEFDLIISLEEMKNILNIVKRIKTKKFIGAYLDKDNKINYTADSSYWYDMSKSSKFGIEKADELKMNNKKSVPEILINMVGEEFSGQEYDIGVKCKSTKGKIGLIDISKSIWPNKMWAGYPKLANLLKQNGYEVVSLGIRDSLKEHIEDINNYELIVCGDTLGMHVALALKKKVVALFNCTPPNEVYDYGRMKKIVSPIYKKYFFKKTKDQEAQEAINVKEVYDIVIKMMKKE